MQHADVDHGLACFGIAFVVFAVSPATADPGEGSFHNPTFPQHVKAFHVFRTPNQFDHKTERLLDEGRQSFTSGRASAAFKKNGAKSAIVRPQGHSHTSLNAAFTRVS
mgnify:CR=1 FL=1